MNSERFIQFLKKLRQDAGRPIMVITDNARYHHSKLTRAFLETQSNSIMVAFLPAYSPELNPDEQVWNYAKARLAKRAIFKLDDMKRQLRSILHSIQKQSDLVTSFFRLSDTQYILDWGA